MATLIRRVRAGEGETLRALRLRALADSPQAFCAKLEEEQQFPSQLWEDRAARQADGSGETSFLAFLDDHPVGLVAAFSTPGSDRVVELVSMWTAPEARRLGLARRLVQAVIDWAQGNAVASVELWVTQGNESAAALYRAMGFVDEGGLQPVPLRGCTQGLKMVRDLSGDRRPALLDRVEREAGVEGLVEVLSERLAPTDLQSLLLEVYRRRAAQVTPARLLEQHQQNRFVAPSPVDPRKLVEFDRLAWSLLPSGYLPVELSPVCPLGTNSALATVDQNRVVSTVRNSEVVADSTNVMALECASRRKRLLSVPATVREPVLLACSQRVVRAQAVEGARTFAHFRLLSMCAAGRDEGGFGFESAHVVGQVSYYLGLLEELARLGGTYRRFRVALTALPDDRRQEALERIRQGLAGRFPAANVHFDPGRTSGHGYYQDVCFKLFGATAEGEEVELGDGGLTDWTQKLLSNRKERLLISGLGVERLCLG